MSELDSAVSRHPDGVVGDAEDHAGVGVADRREKPFRGLDVDSVVQRLIRSLPAERLGDRRVEFRRAAEVVVGDSLPPLCVVAVGIPRRIVHTDRSGGTDKKRLETPPQFRPIKPNMAVNAWLSRDHSGYSRVPSPTADSPTGVWPSMVSESPMYGRSASGTVTVPSGFW